MPEKNKTREELEHDSIQSRITIISAQITANFDVLGEQMEVQSKRLDSILNEAIKTNGRITKLEEVTLVIKTLQTNKWLLMLSILGLWAMFEVASIDNIIKLIRFII